MDNDKKALKFYIIIVFAVSTVIQAIWIYFGETASQAGISTVFMMIPFIIAVVVSKIFYKKKGALAFKKSKPIYLLLSIVIPLAYLGLSYTIFWFIVDGSFTDTPIVLIETAEAYSGRELPKNMAIIISLLVTLPVSIITAFGEEVGWRGFMYPVMQRIWGWKKAIIISGFVWALWHLPIVIAGLYYPPETSLLYVIPILLIEIISLTIIISWLRMKSNSVWPAILFHAFHNYLDQIVFQSFTNKSNSVYFVGEIGIITLFITIIFAVFIIIKERNTFSNDMVE